MTKNVTDIEWNMIVREVDELKQRVDRMEGKAGALPKKYNTMPFYFGSGSIPENNSKKEEIVRCDMCAYDVLVKDCTCAHPNCPIKVNRFKL